MKKKIEIIELLDNLKKWSDKISGCGGDVPYIKLCEKIDKIKRYLK